MRNSETHQKKKIKNYALLAILLVIVATFFSVTIVKLQESLSHSSKPVSDGSFVVPRT